MNELTFRPITAADETDFYTMAEEFYHSDAVLHPIPAEYHRRAFAEMMRSGQYLSGYIFTDGDNTAGFAVTNRMMQHGLGRGFVHPPGIPGTGSGQPFSGMAGGTAPGRCCDAAPGDRTGK